jgi:hypothetical protein
MDLHGLSQIGVVVAIEANDIGLKKCPKLKKKRSILFFKSYGNVPCKIATNVRTSCLLDLRLEVKV